MKFARAFALIVLASASFSASAADRLLLNCKGSDKSTVKIEFLNTSTLETGPKSDILSLSFRKGDDSQTLDGRLGYNSIRHGTPGRHDFLINYRGKANVIALSYDPTNDDGLITGKILVGIPGSGIGDYAMIEEHTTLVCQESVAD